MYLFVVMSTCKGGRGGGGRQWVYRDRLRIKQKKMYRLYHIAISNLFRFFFFLYEAKEKKWKWICVVFCFANGSETKWFYLDISSWISWFAYHVAFTFFLLADVPICHSLCAYFLYALCIHDYIFQNVSSFYAYFWWTYFIHVFIFLPISVCYCISDIYLIMFFSIRFFFFLWSNSPKLF